MLLPVATQPTAPISSCEVTQANSRVTGFGPGRVNLIGEHTDYNDGLALGFPITLGVTAQVRAAAGSDVAVLASDLGETDRFPLATPGSAPGWRGFARGLVIELAAAGYVLPPMHIEVSGNVPRGSGVSSSAALETALCLAMLGLSDQPWPDRVSLARLCSRVENLHVGAQTGLLDQLISLLGSAGHALRIDFRSLATELVPLRLGGWQLVTVDSGEPRALADSGYNTRRDECGRACALLGVASVRDIGSDRWRHLPDPLDRRIRHVLEENQRVRRAAEALHDADMATLGWLLSDSHRSLRDLYEVSTPAVESTVAAVLRSGAAGARLMGGGFGGHVLAVYPPDVPLPDDVHPVQPGPAAHLIPGA